MSDKQHTPIQKERKNGSNDPQNTVHFFFLYLLSINISKDKQKEKPHCINVNEVIFFLFIYFASTKCNFN